MLTNILVVAEQVLMLFAIMSFGFVGYKSKLLTDNGADQLSAVSLNIVTPCLIINALQRQREPELFLELAIAILASVVFIGLGFLLTLPLFRKGDAHDRRVLRFATSFPNCGYMGIPLVEAVIGAEAVIYATAIVIGFNIVTWTMGVMLMGGKEEISLKKAVINPGVIGFAIGFALFALGIKLPLFMGSAVSFLASMNTPIAMLAIGIFIARTNLLSCFTQARIYIVQILRLVVIPALMLLILLPLGLNKDLAMVVVICASAPTAANTCMFASRYNLNTGLASQTMAAGTLLSILTMPVFAALAQLLY